MKNGKNGFTLIELAIVLVIIGMLIGGMLVAQSMISTTKIEMQIKQLQQFDVATDNFVTKYNLLPGDLTGNKNGWINYDLAWTTCTIGSEDGNDCSYMSCNAAPGGECQHFFPDLTAMSGFTGSYDSTKDAYTYGYGNGTAFPTSIIGKGGVLVTQNHQQELFYILIGTLPYGYVFTGSPNRSINPIDAQALDSKIDDGFANSGTIVIANPNGWADRPDLYPFGSEYSAWGACNSSSNNAAYDLTTDPNNPHCILQIKANVNQ